MLIVFPLGLLASALVFDLIYVFTGTEAFATVGFWNIAGGVIGGLLAAIFGFTDWLAIPSGTRAKAIGAWHGIGNVVIVTLFTISFALRWADPAHLPGTLSLGLELLGAGMALVTAWLGGELIQRLGVAVDRGANLNAPNSLSGRPAREMAHVDEIDERQEPPRAA
jgi:uncharacterized membrane protein